MRVILKNGKIVTVAGEEVWNLMKKYNLSQDQAIQLWLEDNEYITNPVVEELEKKAKENKVSRGARKMEKTERKTREKKENPLKKEIMATILDALVDKYYNNPTITVRNDEKYIDLTIENRQFTINLIEHRKGKNE